MTMKYWILYYLVQHIGIIFKTKRTPQRSKRRQTAPLLHLIRTQHPPPNFPQFRCLEFCDLTFSQRAE